MTMVDNLTGKQFGKITVLHRHYDNSKLPHAKWVCQCECGKQFVALATNLKKKIRGIKSCGCYVNENIRAVNSTHGLYHTAERIIHSNMQIRCYNQNSKDYSNYGGRGIFMCDRWLGENGLVHFIEDMGMKPFSDASLERKDVNKGYSEDNCTWIKVSHQAKNRNYNKIKDKAHADQIREEYRLMGTPVSQLAKRTNCSIQTIYKVLYNESWT